MPCSARVLRRTRVVVASLFLCSCAHGTAIDGGSGGFGGAGSGSATHTSAGNGGAGPGPAGPATTNGPATSAASTADAGVTTSVTSGTGSGTPGLLFSEYVEGSSFNKAVEIANRGAVAVSLQGCQIDHYVNGSTTASAPSVLNSTSLQPGGVYVICHTNFSQPLLCNQLDGKIQHTGNDVVALTCNGMLVDVIGRVGENMVWGTPPTSTSGATLRRKCTVMAGDTNAMDAFDPALEWNGFPVDTLSDLGKDICP